MRPAAPPLWVLPTLVLASPIGPTSSGAWTHHPLGASYLPPCGCYQPCLHRPLSANSLRAWMHHLWVQPTLAPECQFSTSFSAPPFGCNPPCLHLACTGPEPVLHRLGCITPSDAFNHTLAPPSGYRFSIGARELCM